MILATHNSLSSYCPKKWWMTLLNPFAKCQSLSIEEQYAKGVRMFDIRVRPHTWEAAHGLVTYDVDVDKMLAWLEERAQAEHTTIYIRLCCENNVSLWSEWDEVVFTEYWNFCNNKYKHLTICGGYMKKGWFKVFDCKDPEYLELYRTFNVYKAKNGWKAKLKSVVEYVLHPTPKYWARKDNAGYIEESKNYDGFVMLDFIEYATEDK
jgi:hypothetical protein